MSIPKPRQFTYYERIRSSYNLVQDNETKQLCTELLNFVEACVSDSKFAVLDFTDKKSEEKISKFLLEDNGTFFGKLFGGFSKFTGKGLFDILSRDGPMKNLNKSRMLIAAIQKHCYQTLCLSAFYCPLELQQSLISMLVAFLSKHQLEAELGPVELTAWTALLLLINPLKLKQQCDGSVEVFTHFAKAIETSQQQKFQAGLPAGDQSKGWLNPCLLGTIQMALGISIKYARNSLGLGIPHELDEITYVDDGIKNMALEFLQAYVVQSDSFCDFSLSVDVLDSILKNFICYFPDKLVELYNVCEEELYSLLDDNPGNQQQVWMHSGQEQKPTTKRPDFHNLHFKTLIELISALYKSDNEQLTQLSLEFTDPNCEGLCEFICRGKAISAPALKIAFLSMLKSLCKSRRSADIFFNLFK